MSHWSERYLGVPYADLGRAAAGCDCYGLVRLVYRQELEIELPDYLDCYASTEEREDVAALIEGAAGMSCWRLVSGLAEPFDIAAFRHGRLFGVHLGLIVVPGRMLHVARGQAARIEPLDGLWRPRLAGIWRHAARGGTP